MKTYFFTPNVVFLFIVLTIASCEKADKLPANQAKGTIIAITGGCYGEIVMIEVENPLGIGLSGSFSYPGKEDELITYQNTIGVPYFSKIGIPDSIPQTVGIRLHFEFQELTEEEKENLFNPSNSLLICPANIIPPSVVRLTIKKVLSNY